MQNFMLFPTAAERALGKAWFSRYTRLKFGHYHGPPSGPCVRNRLKVKSLKLLEYPYLRLLREHQQKILFLTAGVEVADKSLPVKN